MLLLALPSRLSLVPRLGHDGRVLGDVAAWASSRVARHAKASRADEPLAVTVVVRTARGSRLARAVDEAVVALEVDAIDPHRNEGWSVVVTAVSRLETDPTEVERLAAAITAWVPGVKDAFVRVPLTVVTGRPVSSPPVRRAVRVAT